jgi:hypothetical protein
MFSYSLCHVHRAKPVGDFLVGPASYSDTTKAWHIDGPRSLQIFPYVK